jgi:hypothetical protein
MSRVVGDLNTPEACIAHEEEADDFVGLARVRRRRSPTTCIRISIPRAMPPVSPRG